MELSLLLIEQILSLSLMVLMGFFIVRSGLLKAEQSSVLSILTLYVITPCAVLVTFQEEISEDKMTGILVALAVAAVFQPIFIILSAVIGKVWKITAVEKATLIYPNTGNLLFPLIIALLGKEGLLYSLPMGIVQMIYIWTHGLWLVGGTSSENKFKKILLNPSMISIIVGLIMFIFQIKMPAILYNTADSIMNSMGPICMFAIGMVMGGLDLKKVFSKKRLYFICAGRLILCPLVFIGIIALTGLRKLGGDVEAVLLITVMAAGAPAATMISQFANLYGTKEDAANTNALNVMTTLLCIVTMPLMIMLYQVIC